MPIVTKEFTDTTGTNFTLQFYDYGNGNLTSVHQLTGSSTALGARINVPTPGTPVSPSAQAVVGGITFEADPTNTGKVYVFPAAGVKADAVPLSPGDAVFWPVGDVSALHVDADIAGDGVYWQAAS